MWALHIFSPSNSHDRGRIMLNVIGIHIPEFGTFPPDNYLAANAKIFAHYAQDAFFSSQDRIIYIITSDSLDIVKEKIPFISKPGVKDYEFLVIPDWKSSAPSDTKEWLSNTFSAVEKLRNFVEGLIK
jgi:hypothetical protein